MSLKTPIQIFMAATLCIVPLSADAASVKVNRTNIRTLERFGKYACILNTRKNTDVVAAVRERPRIGTKLKVVNVEKARAKLTKAIHRAAVHAKEHRRTLKELSALEKAVTACTPQKDVSPPPISPTPELPPTPRPADPTPVPTHSPTPVSTPTPVPTSSRPEGFPESLFTLEIAGANGAMGQLVLNFADFTYDAEADSASIQIAPPQEIRSGEGALLATIRNLSITASRRPGVLVTTFQLDAGPDDLVVRSRSGIVGVPENPGPRAQARASYFVRDQNMNGVNLQMLDHGIYHPYSMSGDSSREFGVLLGGIEISAGGQGSATHSDPPTGFRDVGSAVDAIGDRNGFSITAGDRVVASVVFRLQTP